MGLRPAKERVAEDRFSEFRDSEYDDWTQKPRGSRNKAERGELFLSVSLGYFKQPSGEVIQEPDEQARGIVQLVFEKFAELGSAYAVFRYFTVNSLHLGFRRLRGERIGELEWRPASATRILAILRHPVYAGAYAYGLHRAGKKDPLTGRTEGGKWFVPPNELPVLIQGRLPAYISWQFLANQEQLKQNVAQKGARGAPATAALFDAATVWRFSTPEWSTIMSPRTVLTITLLGGVECEVTQAMVVLTWLC